VITRLLICAAFALHGTEAQARGGDMAGNGAVAIAVLLGIVVAVPVVERYVRQWLKRPYVRKSKPTDRRHQ
jgi:hypothetical protein